MVPLLKFEIKKINLPNLLFINIAALIVGYVAKQNLSEMLLFIAPLFIIASTIMGSLFGDLTLKNDCFICSLPISRREFIASKYLFPFMMLFLELFISILIIMVSNFAGLIKVQIQMEFIYRLFVTLLIMIALLFPVFLSMSSMKLMAWINLIIYALILLSPRLIDLLLNFIENTIGLNIHSVLSGDFGKYFVLGATVCLYGLSYAISNKVYEKKDI